MIDLDNISFDHCIKCTVCTAYCPVARVTPRYPGPKSSGPDTERLRIKNPELVDDTLKYCTNCKRCEIVCPSDVKIADIIQSARHKYVKESFNPRDFFMSHTDLAGGLATPFAPLVNKMTHMGALKWVLDKTMGISNKRQFPNYAHGTFRKWFRKQAPDQSGFARRVVYFTGCYVNYNDHELGRDVLYVLNRLGTGVEITKEKCCGVPLIANGFIAKARENAAHNVAVLSDGCEDLPIVSASSSCSFCLKSEYPNLLEIENDAIENRIRFITRYVNTLFEENGAPDMGEFPFTVAYHAPCHLERLGGVVHTVGLLQKIPGIRLVLLNSECCGISGTYGFKKEYYDISQAVGSDLFQKIEDVKPDLVATDCETCKWQIEMNTPYPVAHPITILAWALGRRRLNGNGKG